MAFRDVMQNLGDSIAGVDRTGSFLAGQKMRADVDLTQAQTDAAMEQANERRSQAELNERIKEARQRIQEASQNPAFDPSQLNVVDVMLAGMGSDMSGAMQGRLHGQEYKSREAVATPAGQMLGGDVMTEDVRRANMESLSPSTALISQRPQNASGAPLIVQDPDDPTQTLYVDRTGQPLSVSTPSGPTPARPAARPQGARAPATPTSQRVFEWLSQRFPTIPEDRRLEMSMNMDESEMSIYERGRNQAGNFATPEEAHQLGMRAVEQSRALRQQNPIIPPEARPAAGTQDDPAQIDDDAGFDALPSGAYFIGPDGRLRQKP